MYIPMDLYLNLVQNNSNITVEEVDIECFGSLHTLTYIVTGIQVHLYAIPVIYASTCSPMFIGINL